jgi:hypothetical protein
MLFVNAGTTNRDPSQTRTEEFYQVMLTNARADAGYACSRRLNRIGVMSYDQ